VIDWRDRISTLGAVIVSVLVVSGFGVVCVALFFFKIPAEMKELAMLLLGILGAGFTTIVNYWTGSTSSSSYLRRSGQGLCRASRNSSSRHRRRTRRSSSAAFSFVRRR